MHPIKKTKANAGETLVEVVASIFIFLILMGVLEGAIHYSTNALSENKKIRSNNAKIIEALQNTDVSPADSTISIDFLATNADMSALGNRVFSVSTDMEKKVVPYKDVDGKDQTITFYLYGSPETNTPSGGGDGN